MTCRIEIDPSMLESLDIRRFAKKEDPPGRETFPRRIPEKFILCTKPNLGKSLEFLLPDGSSVFVNSPDKKDSRTIVAANSPLGSTEVIPPQAENAVVHEIFYAGKRAMGIEHLKENDPRLKEPYTTFIAYNPIKSVSFPETPRSRKARIGRALRRAGTETKNAFTKVKKSRGLRQALRPVKRLKPGRKFRKSGEYFKEALRPIGRTLRIRKN